MGRYYDTEDELLHYGVLGMKWGIRRYQPYSYTGGGKGKEVGEAARKGRISSAKEKIKKTSSRLSKAIADYKAATKKKREEQKQRDQEAYEEKKKKLRDAKIKEITRDAKSLNANRDLARKLLNNEEYGKIKKRLEDEQRVHELSRKQKGRLGETVDDLLGWSSRGIKAYNQYTTWDKMLGLSKSEADDIKDAVNDVANDLKKAARKGKVDSDTMAEVKEVRLLIEKVKDELDSLPTSKTEYHRIGSTKDTSPRLTDKTIYVEPPKQITDKTIYLPDTKSIDSVYKSLSNIDDVLEDIEKRR